MSGPGLKPSSVFHSRRVDVHAVLVGRHGLARIGEAQSGAGARIRAQEDRRRIRQQALLRDQEVAGIGRRRAHRAVRTRGPPDRRSSRATVWVGVERETKDRRVGVSDGAVSVAVGVADAASVTVVVGDGVALSDGLGVGDVVLVVVGLLVGLGASSRWRWATRAACSSESVARPVSAVVAAAAGCQQVKASTVRLRTI